MTQKGGCKLLLNFKSRHEWWQTLTYVGVAAVDESVQLFVHGALVNVDHFPEMKISRSTTFLGILQQCE